MPLEAAAPFGSVSNVSVVGLRNRQAVSYSLSISKE
jgi:hypothetical protein